MAQETAQTPTVIRQQITHNAELCQRLVAQIKIHKPSYILMIGRGSSDHAGVFAKYLLEIELGIPVMFASPSVFGIYQKSVDYKDALVIAISQSGRSPDIVNQVKSAKKSGALCVALVNDEQSPLAQAVDWVLPMAAGAELSVAATKSYLASLSALLQLTAYWSNNEDLLNSLNELPEALGTVLAQPPQLTPEILRNVQHCAMLGRGLGYAISREMALKLKEVLAIHCEAFSSAEFMHGPSALLANQLHVIDVQVEDESAPVHSSQIQTFARQGGQVISLSHPALSLHPRCLPLLVVLRFYLDIEHIAQAYERDPDRPQGLKKVTETH
ncbi:glucosamine-6-phosphate deaminase NagB-II [Paraglaciecola polaris]|uniref:glucosamine-6-phosphate deaminase NagB-II n=1 Tax=Paraglaciecola polaris TaxID=222814 RepID=UPI0030EF5900|tara:strand:+ start:537 stop:1520 length:984 start_codon:yes stop_codon:yes gene_type:complete